MYIAGVDLGSLFSKAIIITEDGTIISSAKLRSGAVYEQAAREVLKEALQAAGIDKPDALVATGYGRARVSFADFQVSEITCHARGVHKLLPSVHTVVDIGGQDTKVIYVDDSGRPTNFVMNDKCAAGSGRFLEVMADTLVVTLTELGELSLRSTEDFEITSMCTVFAESEVISLKAAACSKENIAAAIHRSIARRISGLVARLGIKKEVGMSGGVAQNIGMIRALERQLGTKVLVPPEPQLIGCYGAALVGAERHARSQANPSAVK